MSRRCLWFLLACVLVTAVECVTQYSLGALVPISGGGSFGGVGRKSE
jgi:hypothetical protein